MLIGNQNDIELVKAVKAGLDHFAGHSLMKLLKNMYVKSGLFDKNNSRQTDYNVAIAEFIMYLDEMLVASSEKESARRNYDYNENI